MSEKDERIKVMNEVLGGMKVYGNAINFARNNFYVYVCKLHDSLCM